MAKAKAGSQTSRSTDLTNNAAWQARLEDARARRAEALKKAGRSDDTVRKPSKPWEEAPKVAAVEPDSDEPVDFHDRMNRFKRISKIAPVAEKTAEELAEINRKVFGVSETTETEVTAAKAKAEGTENIFAPVDQDDEGLPPLVLKETASDDDNADPKVSPEVAETADNVDASPKVPTTSWFRTLFRSVCLMVTAVALFVSANGVFLPALFWDSTPPELHTGLNSMPTMDFGPGGVVFDAPDAFADAPLSGTSLAPDLIQPATKPTLEITRPTPRPPAPSITQPSGTRI